MEAVLFGYGAPRQSHEPDDDEGAAPRDPADWSSEGPRKATRRGQGARRTVPRQPSQGSVAAKRGMDRDHHTGHIAARSSGHRLVIGAARPAGRPRFLAGALPPGRSGE